MNINADVSAVSSFNYVTSKVMECAETLFNTIVKVIFNASQIFRALIMLPVIGIESLINGSNVEMVSTPEIWKKEDTAALEKYEKFAENTKNQILFCPTGPSSVEWKEKLINIAEHSLEISGSYCGGKPFDRLLKLFEQKLEQNDKIVIRILTSPAFISSEQHAIINTLTERYPTRFEVVETASTWEWGLRNVKMIENHGKMFVADQKYFVTGGNNITNWQLSKEQLEEINYEGTLGLGRLMDIDIAGRGDVAKKLKGHFDDLWLKWKSSTGKEKNEVLDKGHDLNADEINSLPNFEALDNQVLLEGECSVINGNASQGKNNLCENEYLKMIGNATNRIVIANFLFNNKRIKKALNLAIRKGVNVEVLTNGDGPELNFAQKLQGTRNLCNVKSLFRATHLPGAGTFTLSVQKKQNTYLHAKMMVVDDEILTIGSFNIDKKSARCDDETILVFKSEEIAKEALKHIENIKTELDPLTEEETESLSFTTSTTLGKLGDKVMNQIL